MHRLNVRGFHLSSDRFGALNKALREADRSLALAAWKVSHVEGFHKTAGNCILHAT